MIEKTKTVYYCEWCRRHGLQRAAMEKHERHCTLNPERVCRWRIDGHSDGTRVIDIAPLAAELRSRAEPYPLSADPNTEFRTALTQADIDWLHDEVSGCPACMLAALRQSGIDGYHFDGHGNVIFDYQATIDRARQEEREAEKQPWRATDEL